MFKRRVPILLQLTTGECAAACLAMISSYYGRKTSLSECRGVLPTGRDGATVRALVEAARTFGFEVKAVSAELDALPALPLPAILHWGFDHFVVLERWSGDGARIVDPARGRVAVSRDEVDRAFTGVAVVLRPTEQFAKRKSGRAEVRWGHYLRHLRPFRRGIALLLTCSFLLQAAGLVVPFATAFVVDHVIATSERSLLPALVAGALLLAVNQLTISNLRERLLLYLKAHLDLRVATSFLDRLLSLPLGFFERRGGGDLLGRVASNATVRDTLSTPVLGALLDGTFALGYLAILFLQDVPFGLVALSLGAAQACLALSLTRKLDIRLQRELAARAVSYDYLAQAFAGIATLKATGGERRALEYWSPLLATEVSATVGVNRIQAALTTISNSARVLFPSLLLLLGTYRVLDGRLTLGSMFALIALASAFLMPIGSLVADVQEIRRARAHLDRIADVLNAPREQAPDPRRRRSRLSGAIETRDVSFAYDRGAPLALNGVSVDVAPGGKLAIVGRTGSGKSTLAKILLGLYRPTSGDVLYDGVPLEEYDLQALRGQFGVVLQEPALFAGTIRDNIAFHCPDASLDWVSEAARMALVHDEITSMPLGYQTPIMHAGGSVSGGQRQRIALAQALARKPTVLVLDEATSHLDTVTEQAIHEELSRLRCTRIVIAHRLSTIRDADHIVVLDHGSVVEQGTHAELLARDGHYSQLVRQQMERPPERWPGADGRILTTAGRNSPRAQTQFFQ